MREKLTQLFTPSTERFYNFRAHDITPAELRDLIDAAPESVLRDQKFQGRIVWAIRHAFQHTDDGDSGGLLAAVNGFVARGLGEGDISEDVKAMVIEDLEQESRWGNITKFEKIKNIFRPILEQTIIGSGETFEHNLLLGLRQFRGNSEGFQPYVSALRRIAPSVFSQENITELASDVIRSLFSYSYALGSTQIINFWEYITEIPELEIYAPDCVKQMRSAIQSGCLYLAGDSEKTWYEIFGQSVAEMGLEQEINDAILNKLDGDSLIGSSRVSEWVTFFDLPHLVPGSERNVSVACRVLAQINLLRDNHPKAELLEYMRLFGVSSEMMLTSRVLQDRWSVLIASDFRTTESVVDLFARETEILALSEIDRRKLGVTVGFELIKKGNFAAAVTLHQSLGLTYVGDNGETVLTEHMHFGTIAAVDDILRSKETFETKIANLVKFESIAGIDRQRMMADVMIPCLKMFHKNKIFKLGHFINYCDQNSLTDPTFLPEFIQAIAQDQQLVLEMQESTTKNFKENNNVNNVEVIKWFIEMGFLPRQFIYTNVRETAVSVFVTQLIRGEYRDDISDMFRLSEEDIPLDQFQNAIQLGFVYKLCGRDDSHHQFDVYDRTDFAKAFAGHCGLGGEYLAIATRKALIECVTLDDFKVFSELVTFNGMNLETCCADQEFRQAVQKSLAKKIAHNPKDALLFITAFKLDDDIPALHKNICQAWSSENKVVAAVLATFPAYLIEQSFGERAIRMATASKSVSFESALLLNNHYVPVIDPLLYRTERVFGSFVGWKEYDYLCELLIEKNIPDELAELGVTRSGEAGVEQLKDLLQDFQRRIIIGEVTSTELGASSMLLGYYMDKTRLKVTEWGKTSAGDVVAKMRTSEQYHKTNPDVTFVERYTQSEILKVGTTKELKDFVFDEDFLHRYRVLTQAILKASDNCDPLKLPLSKKVLELEFCKEQLVSVLQNKLAEEPNDVLTIRAEKEAGQKGVAPTEVLEGLVSRRNMKLQQSIATLSDILLRSVRDVQDNFVELAKYKEFHALLIETVFTFVFMQREHRGEPGNDDNNGLSTAAEYAVAKREPTRDGITWSLNFIDHIVNKEVMSRYFKDKEAAKALRQIASVVALEKQLAKMTVLADDKKTSMQFVPTRGALLEFSGQIGDACWASKYDSIARQFPNFTAVTMVEKPGTESEKLAGSALLIETVSDTGTPLLVIRGLNPLENVINKLQVEDFYTKFTTWAAEQATKMDRKLAIVIDGHSGGSATNRPVLFQFLTQQAKGLQKVRLASSKDTSFNNYDIRDQTYLVYKE